MTQHPHHHRPGPARTVSGPDSGASSGPGETQYVRGTSELVQAVPYLLGFVPSASLVVVGLAAARVVVTVRMDLADARLTLLRQTLTAMARGGATEIVAAVYDEPVDADGPGAVVGVDPELVLAPLRRAADELHIRLLDLVSVGRGRFRSALCHDPGCCPPQGRPVPSAPSSFAVAATVAGRAVLPDRDAVGAQLDPFPRAGEAAFALLLARAERAAQRRAAHEASTSRRRAAVRSLFAAARGADAAGWKPPPDTDAADWAVALRDIEVRDSVWRALDHGRIDGRELWRYLGRRCPSPYDAPPLLLFGWAAWRTGQSLLAGVAADRAAASDPEYSAADLLRAAVDIAVDPRRFPRLPRRSA